MSLTSIIDSLKSWRERGVTVMWVGALLVSIFGHFTGCSFLNKAKSDLAAAKAIIAEHENTIKRYKSADSTHTAQTASVQLDKNALQAYADSKTKEANQLKQALTDANIKLKNVSSVASYTSNTGTNKEEGPIIVTVIKHDTTKGRINLTFHRNSKYYNLSGSIIDTTLKLDTITFPNHVYNIVGTQKKWFLGRSEYVISISNSNPYVTVDSISSFTIKPSKSIFEHPLFYGALGIVLEEAARIFILHKP